MSDLDDEDPQGIPPDPEPSASSVGGEPSQGPSSSVSAVSPQPSIPAS